jgi:hypothetical protein
MFFRRSVALTSFSGLLILAGIGCAVQPSEGEDVSASADLALRNINAEGCDVYVDDFLTRGTGVYGFNTDELVANLRVAPGLKVVGAGGYFFYHEDSKVFGPRNAAGTRPVASSLSVDRGEFVKAERANDGRYSVAFRVKWSEYDNAEGTRAVRNFAYFVDVQSGGETTRKWLKNGNTDFTSADLSKTKYNYSNSIFLGGYSTGSYLWRNSGSPIFTKRNACL